MRFSYLIALLLLTACGKCIDPGSPYGIYDCGDNGSKDQEAE